MTLKTLVSELNVLDTRVNQVVSELKTNGYNEESFNVFRVLVAQFVAAEDELKHRCEQEGKWLRKMNIGMRKGGYKCMYAAIRPYNS